MNDTTSLISARFVLSACIALVAAGCHANGTSTPAESAAPKADAKQLKTRIEALKTKTRKDLVAVKGGTFKMGDFGPIHSEEELPYSSNPDDDVLHEVTLDDFSIGAYKVTYEDFDTFTDATGRPRVAMEKMDLVYRHKPDIPAGVSWTDARAYCQWIGQQIQQPMDIPTEAQWEYAARSGGKLNIFATDTGKIDDGRNVWSSDEANAAFAEHKYQLPIGKKPPTPLGLYDMNQLGYEWVRDWYAPSYDSKIIHNPTGPLNGTERVLRGHTASGGDALQLLAMTFTRHKSVPAPKNRISPWDNEPIPKNPNASHTIRCATSAAR